MYVWLCMHVCVCIIICIHVCVCSWLYMHSLLQLYCAFSPCNCSFTQRLFLCALHRLFLSLLCARWAPFGVECAGAKVEMSRACCCSVSHADAISPITTIQEGLDAMGWAKEFNKPDIVSVLEQVVGVRMCMWVMCVWVIVCGVMCVWV